MIANRKGNSGITQTIVDGSDTTTERLWAMTDANYNVVELIEITNGGWTINDLERYTYDAYGTPTVRDLYYNVRATGTAYDWQHLFTGQRLDLETGLYHYRNRQYHPALGTFITRDPIGYRDCMNLFEYVLDNPPNWVDPMGHKKCGPRVWLYTGSWCVDDNVWDSAMEAAGRAVSCWWDCVVDVNECLIPAGISTLPMIPSHLRIPKFTSGRPFGAGDYTTPLSSLAMLLRKLGIKGASRILRNLARAVKGAPWTTAGKTTGASFSLAELGVSIYCSYKCS